jgi:hypothetical protein
LPGHARAIGGRGKRDVVKRWTVHDRLHVKRLCGLD